MIDTSEANFKDQRLLLVETTRATRVTESSRYTVGMMRRDRKRRNGWFRPFSNWGDPLLVTVDESQYQQEVEINAKKSHMTVPDLENRPTPQEIDTRLALMVYPQI
jgi:hypothetical protein